MFNHANRFMDLVDVKIEPSETKPIVVVYCNPVKNENIIEKEEAIHVLSNPIFEEIPILEPKQEILEEPEVSFLQNIRLQSVTSATLKQSKRSKFNCSSCNYQSCSMTYIKKHFKLMHKNDDNGFAIPASKSKRTFQCDCGYSTTDQSNFRKHSKRYSSHKSLHKSYKISRMPKKLK